MSETTLSDISRVLGFDKKREHKEFTCYGTVTDYDDSSEIYSVRINRDTSIPVDCARMAGAMIGDKVLVKVFSNGTAAVIGRLGGDKDALDAKENAIEAALSAQLAASSASESAESASASATSAQSSASDAADALTIAQTAASDASDALIAAQNSASSASDSADSAQASATSAANAADEAESSASAALEARDIAITSSTSALLQLGFIEKVVDTLTWIAEHGKYELTQDTAVNPDKNYFEDISGEYVLVVNPDPEADPNDEGWYELIINEAVSKYVNTHLALVDDGLVIQPTESSGGTRVFISPSEGVVLYGPDGELARYGENASIGDPLKFHISITSGSSGGEIAFYNGAESEDSKIAYISGQELYISKSVVLNEMRLGTDKWVWSIDPYDDSINLMWIGG